MNTIDNTLPPPGGSDQGLPPLVGPTALLDQLPPIANPVTPIVDAIVAPVIDPLKQIVDPIVAPVIDPIKQIVDPIVAPVIDPIKQIVDPIVAPVAPGSPTTTSTGSTSHTQPRTSAPSYAPALRSLTDQPSNPLADAAGTQAPFGTLQPGANPSTVAVAHGVGLRIADVPRTPTGAAPIGSGPTVELASGTPAGAFASFPTAAAFGAALTAARDRSPAAASKAGDRLPSPTAPGGLAGSGGTSGGGGFSPTFFLALLVALAGLARLLSERVRLPHITWRPIVFIAIQERPG